MANSSFDLYACFQLCCAINPATHEIDLSAPASARSATRVISNNRFFSTLLHVYGWLFLAISGWKLIGRLPEIDKYVAIAAPHTSNWDFPVFMAAVGYLRANVSFLGKHTLFENRFGWFFYWLGGIPVRRESEAASEVVDQVVKAFSKNQQLILGIAPEGTRARVDKWKTGFYRIAVAAKVPILPAYVDSSNKTIGFGEVFFPTGEMAADLMVLQDFYRDKKGINPDNQ